MQDSPRRGRPEAAAAIWDWQADAPGGPGRASRWRRFRRRLAAVDRRVRRVVGAFVGMLLLAPVFYLVLAPAGLLFRRGRRDRLARRPRRELPSYWRARGAPPSLERPY